MQSLFLAILLIISSQLSSNIAFVTLKKRKSNVVHQTQRQSSDFETNARSSHIVLDSNYSVEGRSEKKAINLLQPHTGLEYIDMNEFHYGQRALYGEPCDFELYNRHVRPIFEAAIKEDGKNEFTWILKQQQYATRMKKNNTIRALTCNADHLMECKQNDTSGRDVCRCLNMEPLYKLKLDPVTQQCRSFDGERCFSPLGFLCMTGSACMQGDRACTCEKKDLSFTDLQDCTSEDFEDR